MLNAKEDLAARKPASSLEKRCITSGKANTVTFVKKLRSFGLAGTFPRREKRHRVLVQYLRGRGIDLILHG